MTLLKIYDVIGNVIDDVIFEKQPLNDKLQRFRTEIAHKSLICSLKKGKNVVLAAKNSMGKNRLLMVKLKRNLCAIL